MTIQQLLDVIADGEWYLDDDGNLCSKENEDCPLWYAYRHVDPDEYEDDYAEDYMDAGARLGLREKSAAKIAAAADNRGEPKLRKRMLKAVGLSEPAVS